MQHTSVFPQIAVDALNLTPGSVAVDATAGSGGHSVEIAQRIGPDGTLIVLDVDGAALARTKQRIEREVHGLPKLHYVEENFRGISSAVQKCAGAKADAILADLGWSSDQYAESKRGFSFQDAHAAEPLIMTLGSAATHSFTARDIVNEWREEDIANVLYGYADERYSRRIATAIIAAREEELIETAGQLRDIVAGAVPARYRSGRIHPATKTFQALRIAVNDELDALKDFIDGSIQSLEREGRLAIITFHSIEDRIVKHAFRDAKTQGTGQIITKKPLVPTREEIAANPRARSAKLRIFETDT